jgi:tetratricopeptide (TPR) repeat protein
MAGLIRRCSLLFLLSSVLADAIFTIAQTGSHPQATRSGSPMSSADAALLTKALTSLDHGDASAARPLLEQLTAKYPANATANEGLGILLLEAGSAAQALPFLERAARATKTDPVALANLGAAYLQSGDTAAAVVALQRAAALDPKNSQTVSSLGHALYANKQPLDAAHAFARATVLDPAGTDDFYNGALAFSDAHQDAQAVAILQHLQSAQRTESIESLWGDAEERLGHYKEALEHLQNAARLNPNEANTYALAIELLRHWSWEPAMQITQFGTRQFPESRRLQLANGIAYFGSGRYVEASAIFGALLTLDPDNESYGSLLGRSCTAIGGGTATQCGSLIAFAANHPKNAQIDVSAAISILHQPEAEQHLDQAKRLLLQAIGSDPKLPEAFYQLGVLQQQQLQWKESAASLARAVELRPSFAEAHYRLARAYSHTGQPDLARTEIALQQQYSQQEKNETNARLKEVTIFLTASPNK